MEFCVRLRNFARSIDSGLRQREVLLNLDLNLISYCSPRSLAFFWRLDCWEISFAHEIPQQRSFLFSHGHSESSAVYNCKTLCWREGSISSRCVGPSFALPNLSWPRATLRTLSKIKLTSKNYHKDYFNVDCVTYQCKTAEKHSGKNKPLEVLFLY